MNFEKAPLRLITDEKQRLYYLGFSATDGYVMLSSGETVFVVDRRYYYAAQKVLSKKGVKVLCGSDYAPLTEKVKELGISKVGIDFGVTTLSEYETIKSALPGVELVNVGEEIKQEAGVKTASEIQLIRKACEIAEKSFKEVLRFLQVGVTEREVAAQLEYLFKKNGASDKSFDTIIAFGANAAVPHHETGETKLKENMCVLMDFGCVYHGYCSDMTRTLYFGAQPEAKFLRAYAAVYEAHFAALDNIRSGMTGKQADALARDVLKKYGYGDYFTHSLGHGIGVHIHEYPWLSPAKDNVLQDDMVFSDEPGVYFDGKFGIRIEDSCYLENGVCRTFMKEDKRLIVIKDGKITKRKNVQIK